MASIPALEGICCAVSHCLPMLFSIIFCEAAAIYGVIVTIILQTKVEETEKQLDGYYTMNAMFSGYAILTAGLTTGFANLACGYDAASVP